MNWGEIKAAVRRYLENDEETFTGHLGLYARLAEEDIYRQVQLQWTKQLSVTSIFHGDPYLTIPTDSLSVYSLSIITPDGHVMLIPKDLGFLKEAYPSLSFEGQPRFYAYRDEEVVVLSPTPNATYGVEMHYFRKPTSISLNDIDSNSNWLSENAENAMIFGVILHGYIYEKGDQDVIAMYQKQFDKAVADLKLIAEGRQNKDTYRQIDQRMPV